MTQSASSQSHVWPNESYQLLDFGSGRKLERFGAVVLDRPSPAAEHIQKASLQAWSSAAVRWPETAIDLEPWTVDFPLLEPADGYHLRFQLKLAPFGHVGLFPEQAINWCWLMQAVRELPTEQPRALNLFAYTGGSTLAMAAAGAAVVHVDASQPAVTWARRNAELSGQTNHPVRWIVEDAFKFVNRELRRGKRYDLIVLDPPSYGHDANGKSWKLQQRWQELLDGCLELLSSSSRPNLLWTGHSAIPGEQALADCFSTEGLWQHQAGRNYLYDAHERALDVGYFFRAWKRS